MCACILAVVLLALPRTTVASCEADTIGSPASVANAAEGVILGEALGQTFYAQDTLIHSIAVWRIREQDVNQFGMRLFVLNVDSGGTPIVESIVHEGPTIVVYRGDGINPTKMAFVFDPPIELPAPGTYAVAVQADPCNGFWNILGTEPSTYVGGCAWFFERTFEEGCPLRAFPVKLANADLTFEVIFCDEATPVAKPTWGALKLRYR